MSSREHSGVDISSALSPYPRRRLQSDGATLSYRESGAGNVFVLLHGISSSSTSWVQFFRAMPTHRLIAWDAPGYGESTPLPEESPRAGAYAERLAGLLAGLEVRHCVLVGHSLGALIAGAFAAANPQKVKALVLVNPASGYGAAAEDVRRRVVETRLGQLAQFGPHGLAEHRSPHLLSPGTTAEALELVRTSTRELNPAGYEQAVRMLATARLAHDAPRISAPTLVLAAEADQVTPVDKCRDIASAFSAAVFKVIPCAGHVSYVESPEIVAREILAFSQDAGSDRVSSKAVP